MNENRIYKCMPYGRTPMNFIQRTKEQVRKTDRRTRHESIEKHTSLQKDGVEMRNRPQGMTRNSKKQICGLKKRRRRDPRIRTPLDRWSSDVWHDLINKKWLIIGIDRISDNRNPKSLSHYPRGNGELNTSYPTSNNGVGIIYVTWEVGEKLSNQSSRGWMIYL